MYTNLYDYVPIKWKEYIDKDDLDIVVRYLNNDNRLILPNIDNIFRALELINPENVKIIILGEETYVHPLNACGLCYSVPFGVNGTSEIIHFNKFLKEEGFDHENLCKRGYLLLNFRLTTTNKTKKAHVGIGWEIIIAKIISRLHNNFNNLQFIALNNIARNLFMSLSNDWFRCKSKYEMYKNYEKNHNFIVNLIF